MLINIYLSSWDIEDSDGSVDASGGISLSLECQDCRTWGTVDIDFEDSYEFETGLHLNASLTFNNVGAYFDLAAEIDADISASIGLGKFSLQNQYHVRIFCLYGLYYPAKTLTRAQRENFWTLTWTWGSISSCNLTPMLR
jgi:hypothetical protein